MHVLSLFDGMSCGQIALYRAGLIPKQYYASEIDNHAITITQKNFPNTIQLGDVRGISAERLPGIDLLIGGSPCQGFSVAGKRQYFDDPRSHLLLEYVRLLYALQPRYFLLENVVMPKHIQAEISTFLGVEPIVINSSRVSAQQRNRLYWTNIPNIQQPEDKGIVLQDILEHAYTDRTKSYCIDANYWKGTTFDDYFRKGRRQIVFAKDYFTYADFMTFIQEKRHTDARSMRVLPRHAWRKLTPGECERLQTVPQNYTAGVSDTQRYTMLGNGFTVDVIAHIVSHIPH
jgi:site-specific DNA-cytosine methylase